MPTYCVLCMCMYVYGTYISTLHDNSCTYLRTYILQMRCIDSAKALQSCSIKVEKAVGEILTLISKDPILPTFLTSDNKDTRKRKQEELLQFSNECEELFSGLRHRFLEALLSAVRASLDYLRRKLSVRWEWVVPVDGHCVWGTVV